MSTDKSLETNREQPEFLSPNDVEDLNQLKSVLEKKRLISEIASLQYQIARLTYQNAVLKKYVENDLNINDTIVEETGEIIRRENDEESESQNDDGPSKSDSGT